MAEKYTVSEPEGMAIAAACVAANKLFSQVIYSGHSITQTYTRFMGEDKKENGIPVPLPKNAIIYMFIWVSFLGPQNYFFVVTMIGFSASESDKIMWRIKTISTPWVKESVFGEEELAKFQKK